MRTLSVAFLLISNVAHIACSKFQNHRKYTRKTSLELGYSSYFSIDLSASLFSLSSSCFLYSFPPPSLKVVFMHKFSVSQTTIINSLPLLWEDGKRTPCRLPFLYSLPIADIANRLWTNFFLSQTKVQAATTNQSGWPRMYILFPQKSLPSRNLHSNFDSKKNKEADFKQKSIMVTHVRCLIQTQ